MKYYLAFDLGQGKRTDDSDRYITINVDKYIKKGYFSKLSDLIEFTSQYKNYSDLFLHLYHDGVITSEYVGEPFTISYQGRNDKVWRHLGTNKYVKENKVIFKNDLYLMENPSKEVLRDTYNTLQYQRFDSIDRKAVIKFNLTNELLAQELTIPKFWEYNTAPQSDRDHFDFLTKFTEEIKTIFNAKKRTSVYATNTNYAGYVNYIDSYNNDLINYLGNAKKYGDVQPEFFVLPIKKIVHMLCTSKDDKNETLKVDNTQLFHLANFYLNFYSNRKGSFEKEKELLKERIKALEVLNTGNTPQTYERFSFIDEPAQEYVQIDFWGNEIPYTKKRKK